MAARRASERAVWRRHRVRPWALAAAGLTLLTGVEFPRSLGAPAPRCATPAPAGAGPTDIDRRGVDAGAAGTRGAASLPTVAVVDGLGKAVGDCQVHLQFPGERRQAAQRSGTNGCQAVPLGAVPPGDYLLSAEAPGLLRATRPVHLGPGPAALRLVLAPGSVLSGRVVDASGQPRPGVSVVVSPTGAVAHTNDAGVFQLYVPGPGLYGVEAHHSDWGGAVQAVSVPATDVALALQPQSVLALRVLSGGQPVQGAQALLFDGRDAGPGGQYLADRPTGTDGTVRILGLPPGSYTLGVQHPGGLSASQQPVVLPEGVTTTVTVTLPPVRTGAVAGDVVDAAGHPVPGALVRAVPVDVPPVESDAAGRFRLVGVPEDVDYQLVAVLDTATSPVSPARAGQRGLRLTLPRARTYRGRVLDEAHAPVPAFRLGDTQVQAPDGRFQLRLRPSGDSVAFTLEAPQRAMATLVRPAGAEELGDIVLRAAPVVHGRVQQTDGGPAPGALVVCEGCRGEAADARHLTAVTDGEGRFTLAITGPYGVLVRLLALQDDRLAWAEAGRVGEGALLTLAPPASVRGQVRRASGAPAAGVAVAFSEPLLEAVVLVTGPEGTFSGQVPPGLYQVTVHPDASVPRRMWTVQLPLEHPLELSIP